MSESERWWSVGLVVANSVASTLSSNDLAMIMFPDGVRSLHFGTPSNEDEEIASIGFELRARSARTAEERAQNLAFQARRAAKLPTAPLPVAWVLPLRETDESSARFLDEARDLVAGEQHEMAVIAVHVHLEMQVKTMRWRWRQKRLAPAGRRSLWRREGLATSAIDRPESWLRELLGIEIGAVDEWSEFNQHLARRNAIVHDGQAVEEREAKESIAVVEALVRHLAEAGAG